MSKVRMFILTLSISMALVTPSFAINVDPPVERLPGDDPGNGGGAFYGQPVADQYGLNEFANLDDTDVLARLIYAEAESELKIGKIAVGQVVKNRFLYDHTDFGGRYFNGVLSWKSVMLKSGEFEGLTRLDARAPKLGSQAWLDSYEMLET
jgi:hypothetical protein